MQPIILASASPRRAELLRQLGLSFTTMALDIDETPGQGEAPADYVTRLAREKAVAGYELAGEAEALVLGSDTSVVLDDRILGKPHSREAAVAMLQDLSGRRHQVMTGVALAGAGICRVRLSVTEVSFRVLAPGEIQAYCDTGEPMDKAGGYGIQGKGGAFVRQIQGSYSAVVGLPLDITAELLADAGVPVWKYWIS
ncbi:septum formation protein [Marinobacter daqiaonensis]|uniref:dTTP/UTP pyrophosphatase n=1 Tax=Marinobacter daqiaonensis TaxID=650891 RepID=A0A1I6HC53_9GAMM|nr:nucleoside triphosphate pyrophosphatase [Marinobacter daqiaonensis]SFR52019.1 septum formation protein [Marinobacter daqiaonensis]